MNPPTPNGPNLNPPVLTDVAEVSNLRPETVPDLGTPRADVAEVSNLRPHSHPDLVQIDPSGRVGPRRQTAPVTPRAMQPPDPERAVKEHLAVGSLEANRNARKHAEVRGGPAADIDALLDGTADAPPVLAGRALSRMSAGIRQVLLRWSKLPELRDDMMDCLYIFWAPRDAWKALRWFDPLAATWDNAEAAAAWDECVQDLWAATPDDAERERAGLWVDAELRRFFKSPVEAKAEPPHTALTSPPPPSVPPAREAAPDGGSPPSTPSPLSTPKATSMPPSGPSA